MTIHMSVPSGPYVYQVANSTSPWCRMLTPQPFSEPAGERHQSAWKLREAVGGGVVVAGTVPVAPAKFIGELVDVEPLRLSESGGEGAAGCVQTSANSAKLIEPPPCAKNPFGTV